MCLSKVIDDVTHNVVHMHIDDTRDDVSVDTVNLSFTDQNVEDNMTFTKDISGRHLAYRIVVKDQKVVLVPFAPSGAFLFFSYPLFASSLCRLWLCSTDLELKSRRLLLLSVRSHPWNHLFLSAAIGMP